MIFSLLLGSMASDVCKIPDTILIPESESAVDRNASKSVPKLEMGISLRQKRGSRSELSAIDVAMACRPSLAAFLTSFTL